MYCTVQLTGNVLYCTGDWYFTVQVTGIVLYCTGDWYCIVLYR